MRARPHDSPILFVVITLASAAVFLADLYTPLGIAVWVFYTAPLAVTLLLWRPALPLFIAAVQTILMMIGFVLSPVGISPAVARVNRGFGVFTVWILAIVAWHFIRGKLAVQRQDWLQSGHAVLNEAMAGEQTPGELADSILRCLAEYTGAQAGALYLQDNGGYRRQAAWAVPDPATIPERVLPGEGLLGQCARDGRAFIVSDVPEGYMTVGSALGRSRPRNLLIAPGVVDGAVNSIVELGYLHPVGDEVTELLERVSNSVAMAVRSGKYRARLEELLEETQRQAEELQVQSEDLRATNTELEQQSRVLQESQQRLEEQQTELEQTNTQLEEQTQALETQRDELVRTKLVLERQAQQLEQASRYKSDFLASMSHELRTPLNSALILARLLFENRGGNLTPEQVEYARSIEASGNALLELINDVLDLAKVEAGRLELRPQPFTVARVVDSLRTMFAPVAQQKNLELAIRIAPDAPVTLVTDPQRLEQVLKNLLSNAIKFTDRGSVTLDIAAAGEGRVRFTVTDTGIGIAEQQRSTIFEPFRQGESTLDRRYGGTGLGLSISRELTQLLGGEISVTSELGRGSAFTVVVPERHSAPVRRDVAEPRARAAAAAATDSADTLTRRENPAIPAAGRVEDDRSTLKPDRRTILVVEDDEVFAYILRDLSREQGFQCLVAGTAGEALALLDRFTAHAVVLDIALPDNSGLALLDRLKSDLGTRHIPVHMVSVHDYTETALAMGAVGYMLKPVPRDRLVEALHRLEERLDQRLRSVLIVEDDATQRESLRALLGGEAVRAVGAGSAAECLSALQSGSFDCMVLDLSLPDASGFAVLETISREERYSFPPVIVYTGRELTADEEQTLRRYSSSIIIKGAKSPERLLDEVTLFLHQVVAELPPDKRQMLERVRSRDAVLEGRRVLVVEDDVRNIFALTSLLEPRGVKVQIARNGREALEALDRSLEPGAPPIDLVLMDVMMPEMDGLTATREIRKRGPWSRLPIIALTAKAMKNDHDQVIAAGANDYMAKPLDVEQFLSLVRVWMPR